MAEYRLHGPPGTGKTRALADVWVPRAVERFGENGVVICSLTKTAAAEIASRGLPIPKENIGTLHALAFRSLDRPSIAEGEIAAWNEREHLFRLSGGKPGVEEPELGRSERGTKGDDLMARSQVYRHNRIPIAQWRDDVAIFYRKWKAWMAAEGHVDFTGLIEDALEGVGQAPGRPSVFVVDEAQDCSVLELDLVRKWSEDAEYAVLAGDGDQAIYGWRGASSRAFLGPKIPEDHNYHLKQSYRVPRQVHRVATRWINRASYRYAVDYEPRDFEGSATSCEGNSKNVMPIIEAAFKAAAEGKTVMILASCGFMLRNTITMMRREGIPFHNPYRPRHGGWNPLRGGAGRLLSYLVPDAETFPDHFRIWNWSECKRWVDLVRSKDSLNPSGKSMIRHQAKRPETEFERIDASDGRACFGEHWDELREAFASRAPIPWLQERLLSSKAKLMEYPIKVCERRGTRTLLEEPRITVGTIHSVKGGQADIVFCYPDLSSSAMREWTRPGEGRDGIIRTFYVAMTRARESFVAAGRWSPSAVDWRI